MSAQLEVTDLYRNIGSIWCAGDGLTVSTVANNDVFGIDLRFVADLAAMTTAFNFHVFRFPFVHDPHDIRWFSVGAGFLHPYRLAPWLVPYAELMDSGGNGGATPYLRWLGGATDRRLRSRNPLRMASSSSGSFCNDRDFPIID